jgi:hypothetical protein
MIYQTTGRTIMFSQVGFPTINCHPRPDHVPMFVCYPRHRPRSARWAAICAISRDLRGNSQENETKYIVAMTTNSGEKRLKLKESTR